MSNKIYYKGKVYGSGGETPPIEAEQNQILRGNGSKWADGSQFYAEQRGKSIAEIYLRPLTADSLNMGSYVSIVLRENNEVTIGDFTVSNLSASTVVAYPSVLTPRTDNNIKIEEDTNYSVANTKKYVRKETNEYFTIKLDETAGLTTISPVYDASTGNIKTSPDTETRVLKFNLSDIELNKNDDYSFYFETNNIEDIKEVRWNSWKIAAAKEREKPYSIKGTISFDTNAILPTYDKNLEKTVEGLYFFTKNSNKVTLETNLGANSAELSLSDNVRINFTDNANMTVSDDARMHIADNSEIAVDNFARILLHDRATLDMGGTNHLESIPASAWDGKTFPPLNRGSNDRYGGLPALVIHQNAVIEADGAAHMILHQAPNIIFEGNGVFKFGNYTNKAYSKPEVYLESGLMRLGGYYSRDGVEDKKERKPFITFDVGELHLQSNYDSTGDPFVAFNGGSTFIMNGGAISTSDETDYTYDPAFILSHNELLFDGVAMKGSNTKNGNSGLIGVDAGGDNTGTALFGDRSTFLNSTNPPRTRLKMYGESCVYIGSLKGDSNFNTKTWINIRPASGGKVAIEVEDRSRVLMQQDAAILMTPYSLTDEYYPQGTNGPRLIMRNSSAISMSNNTSLEVAGTNIWDMEIAFKPESSHHQKSGYRKNWLMFKYLSRSLDRIYKVLRENTSTGRMAITGSISKTASSEKVFEITGITLTSGSTSNNLLTLENLKKIATSKTASPAHLELKFGFNLATIDNVYYITKTASGATTNYARIDIDEANLTLKITPLVNNYSSIKLVFDTTQLDPTSAWSVNVTTGTSANNYELKFVADNYELKSDFTVAKIDTTKSTSGTVGSTSLLNLDGSLLNSNMSNYDFYLGSDRSVYDSSSSLTIGLDSLLGPFATQSPVLHLKDSSSIKMWNSSKIQIYNSAQINMASGTIATDVSQGQIVLQAGASNIQITSGGINVNQQGNSIQINPGGVNLSSMASGNYKSGIVYVSNGSKISLAGGATITGTTEYQPSDTDKENPTTTFIFKGIADKEEDVSFTLAELKALKALLTSGN